MTPTFVVQPDKSILFRMSGCRVFIHQKVAPGYKDRFMLHALEGAFLGAPSSLEVHTRYQLRIPGGFTKNDVKYTHIAFVCVYLTDIPAEVRDVVFAHAGTAAGTDLVVAQLDLIQVR